MDSSGRRSTTKDSLIDTEADLRQRWSTMRPPSAPECAGSRSIAIHREIAVCYFALGNYAQAQEHIATAEERQPDNRYLIDLSVQIACAQRDEASARRLLNLLEQVDRPAFAAHRRSRIADIFGDPQEAYAAAHQAVKLSARPPFEILTQLVLTEIKTGRYTSAEEHLTRLSELYPTARTDIQVGLRCRLQISQGRFREALGLWERLTDKARPVHRKLRRDAIAGLLERDSLSAEETEGLRVELDDLDAELSRARDAELDFLT